MCTCVCVRTHTHPRIKGKPHPHCIAGWVGEFPISESQYNIIVCASSGRRVRNIEMPLLPASVLWHIDFMISKTRAKRQQKQGSLFSEGRSIIPGQGV